VFPVPHRQPGSATLVGEARWTAFGFIFPLFCARCFDPYVVPLDSIFMADGVRGSLGSRWASADQVIDTQEDNGSDQGHDESRRLSFLIQSDGTTHPGSYQRSGNADEDGDDDPTRIFAGHDQLRQSSDDETNQNYP